MRKQFFGVVACALVALGVVCVSTRPSVVAQESGKAAKVEKGEGAKKAAKSGDRLPANYTKIGISEEQRKKIYEIQNSYDVQIAALQRQLADLRAKETAEVEAVLTPEQKKALQAANDESKKKAAEKKKASEKEKGSDKGEK
ncbi:hypothetical protein LBMAG52_34090 [Planctomycetia bacterium]|nr:hypothetical protein LBMAG52_34090 [Planctomycetia bacterium]